MNYEDKDIPADLAKLALAAQSACNASGLIHALDKVVDRLWYLARESNAGTDWVNGHPVLTMVLNQLVYLNTGKTIDIPSDVWEKVSKAAN